MSKVVRNLESDEQEIVGSYLRTEEDTVVFIGAGGIGYAPEDCVSVEDVAGPVAPRDDTVEVGGETLIALDADDEAWMIANYGDPGAVA